MTRALLAVVALGCAPAAPAPDPAHPPRLAAPLSGRFVEIGTTASRSDANTLEIGAPAFVSDREFILGDLPSLTARRYQIEAGRVVDVGAPEFTSAATDLDGDGAADCVEARGVLWGCAGAHGNVSLVLPPVLTPADIDGDGRLDLVGSPPVDTLTGPPFAWWRQTAPRTFELQPLPAGPCVRRQAMRVFGGRVVAVGWTCSDAAPADRTPSQIWYRFAGGAWHADPDPIGYVPSSPMDLLDLGGGCALIAEHPEHVEICDGVRVEVPPAFAVQLSDRGVPMIPWGLATITVEGRVLILVAHGIDAWGSPEHDAIGRGRSRVTAWERAAPGDWRLVEGTGLERLGEWRWIAARGDVVVVGGHGEPARVYRFE